MLTARHTGGGSPITSVTCGGARFTNGSDTLTLDSSNATSVDGGLQATVHVVDPGGDLSCVGTDSAGDHFALGSYELHVDDTAPTATIEPQVQWPTVDEIVIDATDPNGTFGSGVASVDVHATSAATGTVDLGYARALGGDRYGLVVDDGTLPAGSYEFSAIATDLAGNSSSAAVNPDASKQLTLPLRDATVLTVTAGRTQGVQQISTPTSIAQANIEVARHSLPAKWVNGQLSEAARSALSIASGEQRAAQYARRRRRHPTKPTKPTKSAGTLQLAWGQAVTLQGQLAGGPGQSGGVPDAPIHIYSQVDGTGAITLLGATDTDVTGRFEYSVPGGASRTLLVTYPGSSTLRSATSELHQTFAGRARINVSQLVAGRPATITGQVYGGYIPAAGLAVSVQYQFVGSTDWGTFQTARVTSSGQITIPFLVNKADAGVVYRLRVQVLSEQGWPYASTISNVLQRKVRQRTTKPRAPVKAIRRRGRRHRKR